MGFRVRVPVSGLRVSVLGFRVSVLGFRVSVLRFRVSVLGFRVKGLGLNPNTETRTPNPTPCAPKNLKPKPLGCPSPSLDLGRFFFLNLGPCWIQSYIFVIIQPQ